MLMKNKFKTIRKKSKNGTEITLMKYPSGKYCIEKSKTVNDRTITSYRGIFTKDQESAARERFEIEKNNLNNHKGRK
jgi:hypothetical protein